MPGPAPQVKIITTLEEFASLAPSWKKLLAEIGDPTPFISHDWLRLWWKHFKTDEKLFIFTVWNENLLIGAIPLMRTRFIIQRIFRFDCLRSLTNPHSPEFDLVCRPENLELVIGLLKRHLRENPKRWELMLLERIRADSGAVAVVDDHFRSGTVRINLKPAEGSFRIPIRGSFQEYFSGLNRSFRKNMRNRNNKLAALGTPEFRVFREYDPEAVEAFFRLENTGWKKTNRSAITQRPWERKFYHEIAERFARTGRFNLSILSAGETPVASIYGLVHNRVFYFMKIGVNYDIADCDKLSPGQAILYRLIRHCFEKKYIGFDFCGPFAHFESQWTKTRKSKHQITVYNLKRPKTRLFLVSKTILSPFYRLYRSLR